MRYLIILFSALCFVNCNKSTEQDIKKNEIKTPKVLAKENRISPNLQPIDTLEIFKDSLSFGNKKKSKIVIIKIGNEDSTFVNIHLYRKHENKWIISDSLTLGNINFPKLHPEIIDFNNDAFNDIIFTSGTAARGGNNVQTLVLYSPKEKSLKWIKNSENFPNLMYNKKLDCIDACILTGGETTYFLKIKNDSLKEFANVDHRDGNITVEILDENGKWKEIKRLKSKSKDMKRFINYNPIEER